jgi:hypothetical protein
MPVEGKFYAVATCVVEVEDQIRLELLLDSDIPLLLIRDRSVIEQSACARACSRLYAGCWSSGELDAGREGYGEGIGGSTVQSIGDGCCL